MDEIRVLLADDHGVVRKGLRFLLEQDNGITIAGMILVNNPGDWAHKYGPVGHAESS